MNGTKTIVIKTTGNSDLSNAIVDGMTKAIIPISNENYSDLNRYKAQLGVRRIRDNQYWQNKIDEAQELYGDNGKRSKIKDFIMGAWALIWLEILGYVDYFRRINRGQTSH